MDYVIETNNLTKQYPRKLAVDSVSMHVSKGDIYGFIGKNGAGKTTTMKMILGLTTPTKGEIRLFGSDDLNAGRRKIGSLIEAPALYKGESAIENLRRFGILYETSEKEIEKVLGIVGLGGTGNKAVKTFSLGMIQRLGIALSLLGGPEILILDEPINGLDPAGIKDVRDIILMLNKEYGVTFLIASHILDELGKIATRYGIINNGVLVEEIGADELRARCQHGIIVKVNDTNKAQEVLRANGYEDVEIKEGNRIKITTDVENQAKINTLLITEGIEVSESTVQSEGFEDYFIERLGKMI